MLVGPPFLLPSLTICSIDHITCTCSTNAQTHTRTHMQIHSRQALRHFPHLADNSPSRCWGKEINQMKVEEGVLRMERRMQKRKGGGRGTGPWMGFSFLVCSYVGRFFYSKRGIWKSDTIKHLARSDTYDDVPFFPLTFTVQNLGQPDATLPDLRSQNRGREGWRAEKKGCLIGFQPEGRQASEKQRIFKQEKETTLTQQQE